MQELIGQFLGQYQIKAKIGAGGMATVFKAYQANLDRDVAIKVLPPALASRDPNFAKRFEREAKAIAKLNHPHILPIYDFGVDRDYSYIVMRYIEAEQTLRQIIRQPLSQERIVELVIQIANALDYAHKRDIIHRDVKPSNVLLDEDWTLLSDFGLAKIRHESATRITSSGAGMGTPAYMSPEQGYGRETDHRTDIYALGVVLYELLTGVIPHDADTPIGIVVKRNNEPPVSPRKINPDIPESIEQVIFRALAIRPEARYQRASDFAAALQQAAVNPSYREPGSNSEATIFSLTQPSTKPDELLEKETQPSDQGDIATQPAEADQTKKRPVLLWAVGSLLGLVVIGLLAWLGFTTNASISPPLPTSTATKQIAEAITVSPSATPSPLPSPTITEPSPTPSPTVIIEIVQQPPRIEFFMISPEEIIVGETREVTLTWSISGQTTDIRLSGPSLGLIPNLEPRGQMSLVANGATDYTLSAFNDTLNDTQTLHLAVQEVVSSPTAIVSPPHTPPSTPTNPTAVPTMTATPTLDLPIGVFTLLNPAGLDPPSFGPTEFEWAWSSPVPPEYGFEIRVWREGEPLAGAHNAVLDNQQGLIEEIGENRYRLNLDITDAAGVRGRSGEYLWAVALVQISPDYADLGQQASPVRFRFEAPGGGSSSGDSSSGSSGGGIR